MHLLKTLRAVAGLFLFAAGVHAAEPVPGLLAGKWKVLPELSTDLTPWPEMKLSITQEAGKVEIARHLSWGRRAFDESMTLELGKSDNVVPVKMWADNRNLGAFINDDLVKHVKADLIDGGRLLTLDTRIMLMTQQGEREVFIHSQLQVSANGKRLTWIELRSTRSRPILQVFERLPE